MDCFEKGIVATCCDNNFAKCQAMRMLCHCHQSASLRMDFCICKSDRISQLGQCGLPHFLLILLRRVCRNASLVGGFNPVEKYEFVNWDDYCIPKSNGKIIQSCSRKTTNQFFISRFFVLFRNIYIYECMYVYTHRDIYIYMCIYIYM